jgi:hypothetical protein
VRALSILMVIRCGRKQTLCSRYEKNTTPRDGKKFVDSVWDMDVGLYHSCLNTVVLTLPLLFSRHMNTHVCFLQY